MSKPRNFTNHKRISNHHTTNKAMTELFGIFNFEKPNILRSFKRDTKIVMVKYCYIFPQRVHVFSGNLKIETMYYILFWRIITKHKLTD